MCSISIYKGLSLKEIKQEVKKYEARRYLGELILLNDRNKSQLYEISEFASNIENRSHIESSKSLLHFKPQNDLNHQ